MDFSEQLFAVLFQEDAVSVTFPKPLFSPTTCLRNILGLQMDLASLLPPSKGDVYHGSSLLKLCWVKEAFWSSMVDPNAMARVMGESTVDLPYMTKWLGMVYSQPFDKTLQTLNASLVAFHYENVFALASLSLSVLELALTVFKGLYMDVSIRTENGISVMDDSRYITFLSCAPIRRLLVESLVMIECFRSFIRKKLLDSDITAETRTLFQFVDVILSQAPIRIDLTLHVLLELDILFAKLDVYPNRTPPVAGGGGGGVGGAKPPPAKAMDSRGAFLTLQHIHMLFTSRLPTQHELADLLGKWEAATTSKGGGGGGGGGISKTRLILKPFVTTLAKEWQDIIQSQAYPRLLAAVLGSDLAPHISYLEKLFGGGGTGKTGTGAGAFQERPGIVSIDAAMGVHGCFHGHEKKQVLEHDAYLLWREKAPIESEVCLISGGAEGGSVAECGIWTC